MPCASRFSDRSAENETAWQGEVFALKFRFDGQYPIQPPAVQFVVDDKYQSPVHPVRLLSWLKAQPR